MAHEVDFMEWFDPESLIVELRRVAAKLGKQTLSCDDIDRHARVCSFTVRRKFGSMHAAHEAAGLVPPRRRLSDDEMLRILDRLWTITHKESGRSPVCTDVKKYGMPVSESAITTRFGTWKKALLRAARLGPGRPKLTKTPPVKRPVRRPMSNHRRFLVFKRDGYRCGICRRKGGELEVDHIVPLCRGGRDTMDNMQTLCNKCNRGKAGDLQ